MGCTIAYIPDLRFQSAIRVVNETYDAETETRPRRSKKRFDTDRPTFETETTTLGVMLCSFYQSSMSFT